MIKQVSKLLLTILVGLSLFGCQGASNKDFSMSQQQWQDLSPQAKELLIKQYAEVKKSKLLNLVKLKKVHSEYQYINVKVYGGSALLWPGKKRAKFTGKNFMLHAGECKTKELRNNLNETSTDLKMCYDGARVLVDPSHWRLENSDASLIIHENMMWKNGLEYPPLSSNGYAQLKNTRLFISAF